MNGKYDINLELEDEEVVPEEEVESLIAKMQPELLYEHMYEQIREPFQSNFRNYLDDYIDQYKYLKDLFRDSQEITDTLKAQRDETCLTIISKIEEQFNFNINMEELKPKYIAKALYDFFIVNYTENMKLFIINFILKNRKMLAQEIKKHKVKVKDVTTSANKSRFGQSEALILTELNYIIFDILPNFGFNEDFLDFIVDEESSLIYNIIKDIFRTKADTGVIEFEDNLFDIFFMPLFDKENGYSTIVSNVNVELFNIYNKKENINIFEDSKEEESEE